MCSLLLTINELYNIMHWNLSKRSKSSIIFSSYFYKQIQMNRASTKCFIFLYTHTRTKWIAISSPGNTYGSKIKSNIQSLNKNTIRYTNRSHWDRFCTTIFSPTKPHSVKRLHSSIMSAFCETMQKQGKLRDAANREIIMDIL